MIKNERDELLEKIQLLEIELARIQEIQKASARALEIANVSLQHTQTVSNEWRKENIDQRALYPTIGKVEGLFATEASERRGLEARVRVLESANTQGEGKSKGMWAAWAIVVILVGWAMAAVIYFTR